MTDTLQAIEVAPSIFGDEPEGYDRFDVTIQMRGRLYGGVPANTKTIEGWLASQAGIKDEEQRRALLLRTLQELGYAPETMTPDQIDEATEEIAGRMNTNCFKRHPELGLYVEGRQVMAMLREVVSILFTNVTWKRPSDPPKAKGKAAKSLFREICNVPTDQIYLGAFEADGTDLKIVHPQDPSRESSLTYVDYVDHATLNFTVEALAGIVDDEMWRRIWVHAERNGLGAMRSQQAGKFNVIALDKV